MTLILAYWPALSIVLILMLFGVFFVAPGWASVTAGVLFSLSMAMTIFSVVQKQKNLHPEKPAGKIKLALNILFEIMGVLVGMTLAGFLGRYLAQIMTQQISNDLTRFAAGIAAGLLVGIGVGLLMQRIRGRFMKTSTEN